MRLGASLPWEEWEKAIDRCSVPTVCLTLYMASLKHGWKSREGT